MCCFEWEINLYTSHPNVGSTSRTRTGDFRLAGSSSICEFKEEKFSLHSETLMLSFYSLEDSVNHYSSKNKFHLSVPEALSKVLGDKEGRSNAVNSTND